MAFRAGVRLKAPLYALQKFNSHIEVGAPRWHDRENECGALIGNHPLNTQPFLVLYFSGTLVERRARDKGHNLTRLRLVR